MKKKAWLLVVLALLLACLPMSGMAEGAVRLTQDAATLQEGDTLVLAFSLTGDAANGQVQYQSSQSRVASVDENGVVSANEKGQATITVTAKNGRQTYRDTLRVTVQRPVTDMTVNENNWTVLQSDDLAIAGLLLTPPENPEDTETVDEEGEENADDGIVPVNELDETDEPEEIDPYYTLPVLVAEAGKQIHFNVVCRPTDASVRAYSVLIGDETIARMTASNSMRTYAPGECLLEISSVSNPEVTKAYRLLVIQPVEKVTISASSKTIDKGDTMQMYATVSPANATITAVRWTSSRPGVATIDENGLVTGISRGQTVIRATAADGSEHYNQFTLTVAQKPESVTLDASDVSLPVGKSRTLRATVLPKAAADKSVTWRSSDARIARVSANGTVTAVSEGSCAITAECNSAPGVVAEAWIHVVQPIRQISVTPKSVTISAGEYYQLSWTTSPASATDHSVSFSTSNSRVATVDENGLVYANGRGSCTITIKANDGSGKTAKATVKVTQPVTGVHMKNDTVMVGVGESVTITAVLEPSDAGNNRMTWTSEDPQIATVSGNTNKPKVRGRGWGTTRVWGTTQDGGYSTYATVRVGNFDRALRITQLYLENNKVKMSVLNDSDMNVTRFDFEVELYDLYNAPLVCNMQGTNVIDGSYIRTIYPGNSTQHGRFGFGDFIQPQQWIGRMVMRITSYRTDEGYSRTIPYHNQTQFSYVSPYFVGPTPLPTALPTPTPPLVELITPDPSKPTRPPMEPTEEPIVTPVAPPVLSEEALRISGSSMSYKDGEIGFKVSNRAEYEIIHFNYVVELWDNNEDKVICNPSEHSNALYGEARTSLAKDGSAWFNFDISRYFTDMEKVAIISVRITDYTTADNRTCTIRESMQPFEMYEMEQSMPTNPPTDPGLVEPIVPPQPDPTDDGDVVEPIVPAGPTEPEVPVEPDEPQPPAEPVEPQPPAEPVEPQPPAEPVEPQPPAEPVEPQPPAEPVEPQPPVESEPPAAPVEPVAPQESDPPTEPVVEPVAPGTDEPIVEPIAPEQETPNEGTESAT